MNKFILAATLISIVAAGPAAASSAGTGNISYISGMSNGALLFQTDGARTATPSCQAPQVPTRFAIDASTVSGQAEASALLTAYALGKKIEVMGTGACSIWSDTETAQWVTIDP